MIKNKLGAKIITKFAFPRQKIIHTRKIMVVKWKVKNDSKKYAIKNKSH